MADFNPELCNEKHKRVEEKLQTHDIRLNNHSDRIDQLEQYRSKTEEMIKNLCEKIDGLIKSVKWLNNLFATTLVGFFVYVIKTLVERVIR